MSRIRLMMPRMMTVSLLFFCLFFFGWLFSVFKIPARTGKKRFPSWPVWSPRFSKLRLSKRGDGIVSSTSPSSAGIGGGDADTPVRPPRNWRPISPLACRPDSLMPAPTTVAKPQHSPSHESSLGHSRYRYVIPPPSPFCVCFFLLRRRPRRNRSLAPKL